MSFEIINFVSDKAKTQEIWDISEYFNDVWDKIYISKPSLVLVVKATLVITQSNFFTI